MIRVTVWNENKHEGVWKQANVIKHYPNGIHTVLKDFLQEEFTVQTVTQFDSEGNTTPNAGITPELLENTDVMIWWGHMGNDHVPDEVVKMVTDAVRCGMGIIFLHSSHLAKPFKALMGTSCCLNWRESGDTEKLWVVDPSHPIAQGLPPYITLPSEEMYGEPFGIPEPDKLVFIGSFSPGEVFRSGCCWQRDNGKIFYFQPGHESCPTYLNKDIQRLLINAVKWCYSPYRVKEIVCHNPKKPE